MCPSGVARKIAAEASANEGAERRSAMPIVHAAVDHLVHQNVSLSWKSRALPGRSRPYRIARADGSLWDSRK
jgi:hypothetical protein